MDNLLQYSDSDTEFSGDEHEKSDVISKTLSAPDSIIYHTEVTADELEHPSMKADFFGLNHSSDEEAESKISHTSEIYVPEWQSTKSSNLSEIKDCKSDFWDDYVADDNWHDPESVWGISDKKKFNKITVPPVKENLNCVNKYKSKRSRQDNCDADYEDKKRLKTVNNDCIKQSLPLKGTKLFSVHPSISSHLNQYGIRNSVPKKMLRCLTGHAASVNRTCWCISEFSHLLLSVSMDRSIKIWNAFSSGSSCVQTILCHQKAVKDAVWSSTGRQILSCGYDLTARISDVEKGMELSVFDHKDYVTCVKYHPTDYNLFVTGSSNILMGWDSRSPKPIRRFTYKDRFGQVQDLCFINGEQFVTCNDLVCKDSADRNIMAWDFQSGVVLSNQIYQERYTCTRLCKHPHKREFIAQSQGDYIAQFDGLPPYKMNKCKRFDSHKVSGFDVGCDISPDGKIIASGNAEGQMVFYDYQFGRMLSKLNADSNNDVVLNVVWHPILYSTVAVSTWNGQIQIWQ